MPLNSSIKFKKKKKKKIIVYYCILTAVQYKQRIYLKQDTSAYNIEVFVCLT